jgi:phasin family protein
MANTHFSDWTKIFGEFKTPAVDVNHIIAQFRRNAETGSTIIQIFTESAQANARHLAEIARSNAEHALKASKKLVNHSSPEAAASEHADFVKTWLDFNVNSLRELAETSTKSTQEAFDVISKRVAEQVKEFSDTASTASHSKKKAA